MAAESGTTALNASARLAELLPQLIDKLTPGGQMHDGTSLNDVLGVLKSKLLG